MVKKVNRMSNQPESWSRYEKAVIYRLDTNEESLKALKESIKKTDTELFKRLNKIDESIASLQTRASIYGASFGALSSAIISIIVGLLLWHFKGGN